MFFGCSLSQINHIVDGHLQCAVSSCLYATSGGQKSNCDSRNFVSHVTCYVGMVWQKEIIGKVNFKPESRITVLAHPFGPHDP